MLNSILTSYAASSIYESESNNTYSTADQTYDGYDNYGKISSSSDVDWWHVQFSSSGWANFWLGNIPSGCDYDLYVYKSNGTTLLEASTGYSNQELIRYDVTAGSTYRIKVVSNSGYSTSYYRLRCKWYATDSAKVFTCDYEDNDSMSINTRDTASLIIPDLWNMGYDAGEYENNSASSAYSALPNSDVVVIHEHGASGIINFYKESGEITTLAGEGSDSELMTSELCISDMSSNALSDMELLVFGSCYSGKTSAYYDNLVDAAIEKGAKCAIGWKGAIDIVATQTWLDEFFYYCGQGETIISAMDYADTVVEMTYDAEISDVILNRYTGDSSLYQVIG